MKAALNRAKHKISFDTATRVFLDPFALSEQDRIEGGECRWRTIDRSMVSRSFWSRIQSMTMGKEPRAFASFRLAGQNGPKRGAMRKKNIVSYELDPEQPKPLAAAQKAELEALAGLPESQIDTSDIPPLSEAFWKNAVRNPFYRPVKRQLTARLDADVLAWLRATGRGYQTKLNDILRQAMLREIEGWD